MMAILVFIAVTLEVVGGVFVGRLVPVLVSKEQAHPVGGRAMYASGTKLDCYDFDILKAINLFSF